MTQMPLPFTTSSQASGWIRAYRYLYSVCLLIMFLGINPGLHAQNYLQSYSLMESYTQDQLDSLLVSQGIIPELVPINYDVDAYKVLYNTVAPDSTPTVASGVLIVPRNTHCSLSLLCYNHGTTGRKVDVPSYQYGAEYVVGLIGASDGYAVVMPDYLGLGDNDLRMHPYIHAHSQATCAIDMIRAGREAAAELGKELNTDVFLTGYSQGGHVTAAAHKLIQELDLEDIEVTASAPMSGPYDVSGVQASVIVNDSVYSQPAFLPYVVLGLNSVYQLYDDPSEFFLAPWDSLMPALFYDHQVTLPEITTHLPEIPNRIMQPAILEAFRNDPDNIIREVLREQDVYDWIPEAPMTMYYCEADEQVFYRNALVAYEHMKGLGAETVDIVHVNPNLGHNDCAPLAILMSSQWMRELRSERAPDRPGIRLSEDGNRLISSAGQNNQWMDGDSLLIPDATGQEFTPTEPGVYYVRVGTDDCYAWSDAYEFVRVGRGNYPTNAFSIYPNPTEGRFHLAFPPQLPVGTQLTLEVRDALGRSVLLRSIPAPAVQTSGYDVDLSGVQAGLYTLHVRDESGRQWQQKLIRQ